MIKCDKPLSDLVTLSAKSSKWTALMGQEGQLSTLSRCVAKLFDALCHNQGTSVMPCLRFERVP